LTTAAIDVTQAVLATWADGAALEAFVVRSHEPPDVVALQDAFESSLRAPLFPRPVANAEMTFTEPTGALYTSCEIVAPDQPGLLHSIAGAFADARVDVHAARVTTVNGVARDRFDLSDSNGNRLDAQVKQAVRVRIVG
jgi:UTP:GlnB (protein PII) uridylyltransferase